MEELKQELRALVAKNRIRQVLKKLNDLPKDQKGGSGGDIITLQQQFAEHSRNATMGILDPMTASREKTMIVQRILSIIDVLGEEVGEENNSGRGQVETGQLNGRQGDGGSDPVRKKKILFLASNPKDTGQLRLGEEHKKVEQSLRESSMREQFELTERFAVDSFSLFTALLDETPQIVHFSGHGERSNIKEATGEAAPVDGESRSMVFFMPKNATNPDAYSGGIVVEDDSGMARIIEANLLAELFGKIKGIDCVILNACYSEVQADAILKQVPYVIGMNTAVPDSTAINFAKAFYRGLGNGRSYENAFDLAKISVGMSGTSGAHIPVFRKNEALLNQA